MWGPCSFYRPISWPYCPYGTQIFAPLFHPCSGMFLQLKNRFHNFFQLFIEGILKHNISVIFFQTDVFIICQVCMVFFTLIFFPQNPSVNYVKEYRCAPHVINLSWNDHHCNRWLRTRDVVNLLSNTNCILSVTIVRSI